MTDDFERRLRARADAVPDVVTVSPAGVLDGVRRRRRARRARRSLGAGVLVVAVGAGVWAWDGQAGAPEVTAAQLVEAEDAPAVDDAPAEGPQSEDPEPVAEAHEPVPLSATETYATGAAATSARTAGLTAALSRGCDERSTAALAAVERFLPLDLIAAGGLEPLLRACLD